MAGSATHLLMAFARWALANPDAALDVERIRLTFLVNRRTACRWRRAWRSSARMVLPCDVGHGRRGARAVSDTDGADDGVMGYARAACGVGRHG